MLRTPLRFSFLIPLAISGLLLLFIGVGDSDEAKDRSRPVQKELAKARESLHEAQLELAEKAERIAELEAQLKEKGRQKASEAIKPKVEVVKPKAEAVKPKAEAVKPKAKVAKPKAEVKLVGTPHREKPQLKEAPESATKTEQVASSFTVQYERNSAANLDGREAALKWVREGIKSNGAPAGFHIVGWANESKYADVNEEIAKNRARYLADYLKLQGIPEKAILSVSGKRSELDDKNGRRCEISSVAGKSVGEKKGAK